MRYPNLGEMMTIQAKRWKNKPLVYFEDKVYTYMQVEKMANKAARMLKEKGLKGLKEENLNKDVENLLVHFFQKEDNRLVLDAKGLNAALRTAALAFEATYLGFGLPALNQKRLEKKYLTNEAKNTLSSAREQASATTINSKTIKANEVKIFNKFIK